MARRGRRGEGTVYWSKADKRWIARWPLGTIDGKRTDKRAKFRTRDEADEALVEMRRLYRHGGSRPTATLDEYLADWLPAHARSVRPSTATSYRGHVRLHISPLLGGIPINQLRPSDVRRLVADLERKGKSAGTVHLVIRTLSAAMGTAVRDRILTDNPCMGVRLPRLAREPVAPMTIERADAIVDAVTKTWLERPVRVLLGSGMRLGELVGLDQGDLVLDAGYVRVRRSKTTVRAVPVSDDAVAALRAAVGAAPRKGPAEPVFFSPRRTRRGDYGRLLGSSVTHGLKELVGLSPHALRHGAATLMLAQGTPMRVISEQLGHRNPALTARVYAHVVPEAQRVAVGALPRVRTATGVR